MRSLEELRSDYHSCNEKLDEIFKNTTQKAKEISDLKLKIDHIKPLVEKIDRKVNNEIRGFHTLSANEFIDLKKELIEKKSTLAELTELLPFHERDLKGLSSERQNYNRVKSQVSNQMADIFANQAANDIAETTEDKLRVLVNSIQSQSSTLLPEDRLHNELYRQIGEKICATVYKTGDNMPLLLPTTRQAIVERDALIEGLA